MSAVKHFDKIWVLFCIPDWIHVSLASKQLKQADNNNLKMIYICTLGQEEENPNWKWALQLKM